MPITLLAACGVPLSAGACVTGAGARCNNATDDATARAHTLWPSRYWQNEHAKRAIVPINMLGKGETFLHEKAQMLFGSNVAYQVWQRGTAVPPKLVDEIVKHVRQ